MLVAKWVLQSATSTPESEQRLSYASIYIVNIVVRLFTRNIECCNYQQASKDRVEQVSMLEKDAHSVSSPVQQVGIIILLQLACTLVAVGGSARRNEQWGLTLSLIHI